MKCLSLVTCPYRLAPVDLQGHLGGLQATITSSIWLFSKWPRPHKSTFSDAHLQEPTFIPFFCSRRHPLHPAFHFKEMLFHLSFPVPLDLSSLFNLLSSKSYLGLKSQVLMIQLLFHVQSLWHTQFHTHVYLVVCFHVSKNNNIFRILIFSIGYIKMVLKSLYMSKTHI